MVSRHRCFTGTASRARVSIWPAFLALPDVGFPRSRGRIHGLALWLPPDSTPDLRSRVTAVAYSIRRLTGGGVDVAVSPWIDEVRPVAANPSRWTRKSRCWVTAFPALHERRVELDLHELTRWCEHAGLPAPQAFRSARCPLVRGALDLAPVEVNRPGRPGLPYSHLKIWFDRARDGSGGHRSGSAAGPWTVCGR